ncbi:hypothetical protein EOI86_15710 [Hwanghaeella grinnelliae]|uniref:Class I SAM-dependent methyltransferase n=1 Tax=Hwanghaeella grinnelliae TaxID=2500179 RepID=A0A3S2Y354_9PROT|nr:hypothetical protein [Hwanghaeella grinnelliae]RVU36626.1 hypothetical protein EOI86_15710 [Hwanghaeella grinnelliae]
MLTEALLYLATPCPGWARHAGYLRESIAIGARHRRLKADWADHLTNTKNAVLQAAARCGKKRRAVVMGSGHGFDLPLESLAATFGQIDLVDAVHPLSMRLRARGHRRLSLIDADVTGRNGPRPAFPADTDLIVSLNLVSQLGVAPGIDPADRAALRQRHLAETLALGSVACVIGDVERRETRRGSGEMEITQTPWSGGPNLPDPAEFREWQWPVAPFGEIAADLDVSTTVRAAIWS